jgi:NADH:ubiquinone oxidoreductase subunit 2 (subunit N)
MAAKAIVLALTLPADAAGPRRIPATSASTSCCWRRCTASCLVTSSDSFLTLFLGLEIMSMPVYVLVLLAYQRPAAAEAALKYLCSAARRPRCC